jgi:hypothetical protein
MNLQDALKLKLSHSSLQDIAQMMGYSKKSRIKAAIRIENVLSDHQLNLYVGAFDFRYSNKQFLDKLCEVVGIEISDFETEIKGIQLAYDKMINRFKSYVFIDTGFKRKGQPVFILSMLEPRRYIQLDCKVQLLPIHEQVAQVQSLVKQHYIDCNGTLEFWGNIQSYIFFYAEGCKLALNVDGVILVDDPSVNISKASMSINNTDLTKLLVKK